MKIDGLVDHACLTLHGRDQPGLVARVSSLVVRHRGNIISLDQYSDNPKGGNFFQRMVFHCPNLEVNICELESDLKLEFEPIGINYKLVDQSIPKRMAILVSKRDHCLVDLLWQRQRGMLAVDIPLVISNHPDHAELVRSFGIPYYYVQTSPSVDKAQSEARIIELLKGANVDFIVLARYMQVLSNEFIDTVAVPIINIHHSFLPAFVGANPYRRAKERGVKLIGATAHYVTQDLDEGPIIEQGVTRVNHAMTVAQLRERGGFVERSVLSRAVTWHANDRIIRNDASTVVFA